MKIGLTPAAVEVVRRVRAEGRSDLVMVLGNGCCDSTAPYLYDHYLPEPDSETIGECDGIPVVASAWLRRLYPDNEGLTIDVSEGVLDDSMSLETEYDCRFVLRAH